MKPLLARNPRTIRSVTSLAVLVSLLWGGERMGAQSTDQEYQVKAAFLFHFTQLVDWPDDALAGSSDSVFLCTLEPDPFQGALEGIVAGKAIGNRILKVRHLKRPEELAGCQVLFLGKAQGKRIPGLLADLHSTPVLTVGETPGFLEAGGMIGFVLEENKVRFRINLEAAKSARLKIGSRLLILAQAVISDNPAR
jgi:hypothetical protein